MGRAFGRAAPGARFVADLSARSWHGEAAIECPATLQHELRLPGHPVRLGPAAGQHVGRVRAAGRAPGPGAAALAGGAHDRPAGATDHRGPERSYLGSAGAATP